MSSTIRGARSRPTTSPVGPDRLGEQGGRRPAPAAQVDDALAGADVEPLDEAAAIGRNHGTPTSS